MLTSFVSGNEPVLLLSDLLRRIMRAEVVGDLTLGLLSVGLRVGKRQEGNEPLSISLTFFILIR